MKKSIKLLRLMFLSICAISCSGEIRSPDLSGGDDQKSPEQEKKKVLNEYKYLASAIENKSSFSRNDLWGTFYNDRAQYYVIRDPDIFVGDSRVIEATFYTIDGILLKKKYSVSDDISRGLIQAYGNFKVIPRNKPSINWVLANREELRTNFSIDHPQLNFFSMIWISDNMKIEYIVKRDSMETQFELIEESLTYQKRLKGIKNPALL